MIERDPEVEQRWSSWLRERNRRGMRTTLVISGLLYAAFGFLDPFVARGAALTWLWSTRVVFLLVTAALAWSLRSGRLDAQLELVSAAYGWLAAAGICVMTANLGGMSSPYYAGITLVIVGGGLLFVWRGRVFAGLCVAIAATFVGANLLAGRVGSVAGAVSNLAFMGAAAVIAGFGHALLTRTHHDQLAQQVRLERTTANLERAHAELKKLERFKSRFFANMTHELRTPLAVVLTPLELMLHGEMGTFSEAQLASFRAMMKSALKLLKLINDLLDLSRLEESRLRLRLGEHDLVEHLQGLAEGTQVLAQRKGIELRFEHAAPRLKLVCDLERLERVFVNLLSNAVKFTQPGGHVRMALVDRPEAVEIAVEDDGPGFPPAEAEKLFERFYQVDTGTEAQFGGTGIGLALARELVALHGGGITAESDGVRGARFTVTLPRSAELRPEPADAERADHDAGSAWAVQLSSRDEFRLLEIEEVSERRLVERDVDEESRPYTVVVVEDNPKIVRLVHMSLRREFKVLTAADGLRGLELVQRERPTLVVTDLMMPELDGLELTRRLREDPRTRDIPVLMLTARGEAEDRVKGMEAGVSAYLAKPFSPRELVTSARRLVQAREETADLVLSQRMESLEIVAAGLAHEINNPLNYVKNSLARVRLDAAAALELAREAEAGPLSPEARARLDRLGARVSELLGVADSGLKRIAGTVELMGRYGRAGFRRELVLLDVWEAVRTVVGVVLPATGRKVTIDLQLTGDGTVDCVPEELNQVISNLVQNAIEAAPEEGGWVRISGAVEGEELVLSVKDNGPGVPQEVQARLFTPFFTTKGPGRGTGLGLTIARRVVRSLRGSLQLVSTPGQGAELVARLPRRQGRRELPPLDTRAPGAGGEAPPRAG